jgi:hypothetical protein
MLGEPTQPFDLEPKEGPLAPPKPQGSVDVSSYKEGQRLKGSDGKFYRMRGGKPVPE